MDSVTVGSPGSRGKDPNPDRGGSWMIYSDFNGQKCLQAGTGAGPGSGTGKGKKAKHKARNQRNHLDELIRDKGSGSGM